MKITYGQAKVEEALRLSVLLKNTYIEANATKGVTEEFANFVTNRFSVDYIEESIFKDSEKFLVASLEGNPIGVMEIDFDSICPITKEKLPEISKLYVLGRFTNKGVGSVLLQMAEKMVSDKGHCQFWLEVWVKNPSAVAFYEKNGFKILEKVDCVMEENTYQNFVMKKHLL